MTEFVEQVYHVSNNPVKPMKYHKTDIRLQIYKAIV